MRRIINLILLFLSMIEGIVALFFLFSVPSMEKNAVFLGYSLLRCLTGTGILFILVPVSWCGIRSLKSPLWLEEKIDRLQIFLQKDHHLLSISVLIIFLAITCTTSILLFSSSIAERLEMINVVYERAFSIIIYIDVVCIQLLLFLRVNYSSIFRDKNFLHINIIINNVVLLLIAVVTVFHWLILYLRVNLYNQIPYWYWKFWQKESQTLEIILFFIFVLFISLFFIWIIHKYPDNTWRNLFILILLGVAIQASFGFLEGGGFEALRMKFVKAGHNAYAQNASFQPDVLDSMVRYEEIYGEEMYLDTKPPGLLLFNLVVQRISNSINPVFDFDSRYERLTQFMVYVFPVLSFLVLILIFRLSRSFLSQKDAYFPCIAYIFMPNVILMVLELDQVLFPLLFMGGLMLWKLTMDKNSFPISVITGCFFYFCIYTTFSLLPLMALMFFWYLLEWIFFQDKACWRNALRLALGMGVGIVLSWAFCRFFLNYDILLRYQNSMARHNFHKQLSMSGSGVMDNLLLNNLEFAVWCGFPLLILFFSKSIRALYSIIKNKYSKLDIFTLAFLLTYILLNVIGQTRSEVGRLWIFLLPVIVLFSSEELYTLIRNKKLGITLFIILQLITIFLTYQFQDAINL